MAGKPETALQTSIVTALRQMGFWVIVMNVTKRRGKRGVNRGEPGMPDLHLVSLAPSATLPGYSTSGWLEVKMPGETLSDDQIAWHERAKGLDIPVDTVWSVGDAVRLVKWWKDPY